VVGYICIIYSPMGRHEYEIYVNETISLLNDKVTCLYESMMDREDSEVLSLCSDLLEKINLIKEYHTDESLL